MRQLVRFRIDDADRFSSLAKLFEEIKAVKNLDYAETLDKGEGFHPRDAEHDMERLRAMVPGDVALGWSLARVLDRIDASDYRLISCEMSGEGEAEIRGDQVAEIRVEPVAVPYGSLEPFVELVEGFGFEVLATPP